MMIRDMVIAKRDSETLSVVNQDLTTCLCCFHVHSNCGVCFSVFCVFLFFYFLFGALVMLLSHLRRLNLDLVD